jgi:hypothetical protein
MLVGGHARSLIEGLDGAAIRSAVRDLSGPQGPGPGQSSGAPVRVRGLAFRAQASRRVAADRAGSSMLVEFPLDLPIILAISCR